MKAETRWVPARRFGRTYDEWTGVFSILMIVLMAGLISTGVWMMLPVLGFVYWTSFDLGLICRRRREAEGTEPRL